MTPGHHRPLTTSAVEPPPLPPPVDLQARRDRARAALAATAAAPVSFLPAALLDALQGSWGTPEELGLRPATPHLRAVSR